MYLALAKKSSLTQPLNILPKDLNVKRARPTKGEALGQGEA
jgi:hypothetical protein